MGRAVAAAPSQIKCQANGLNHSSRGQRPRKDHRHFLRPEGAVQTRHSMAMNSEIKIHRGSPNVFLLPLQGVTITAPVPRALPPATMELALSARRISAATIENLVFCALLCFLRLFGR